MNGWLIVLLLWLSPALLLAAGYAIYSAREALKSKKSRDADADKAEETVSLHRPQPSDANA